MVGGRWVDKNRKETRYPLIFDVAVDGFCSNSCRFILSGSPEKTTSCLTYKKCDVVLELILTATSVFCCCNSAVIVSIYLFIFYFFFYLQFYVTAVTQAN